MGANGQLGSIKLPSGRFQVRYVDLGKRIAADTTFATKADACAYLAERTGRHTGETTSRFRGGVADELLGSTRRPILDPAPPGGAPQQCAGIEPPVRPSTHIAQRPPPQNPTQ